jgi:hypothetical protein
MSHCLLVIKNNFDYPIIVSILPAQKKSMIKSYKTDGLIKRYLTKWLVDQTAWHQKGDKFDQTLRIHGTLIRLTYLRAYAWAVHSRSMTHTLGMQGACTIKHFGFAIYGKLTDFKVS